MRSRPIWRARPSAALQKIDALIKEVPGTPGFTRCGRNPDGGRSLRRIGGRLRQGCQARSLEVRHPGGGCRAGARDRRQAGADEGCHRPDPQGAGRRSRQLDGLSVSAMALARPATSARAELATAEGYWEAGNFRQAKIFAARAQQKFRPNSPQWLQAQEIITTKVNRK